MNRPQQGYSSIRARRARAVAVARSRQGFPVAWLLPLLAAAALLAGMELAAAQDNPPSPPGTIATPGSQAANPTMMGQATQGSPGTALATSNGVIRPPAGVDPAIRKQPPVAASELPTPVLKPSQTAQGGDTIIQPK